MRTPPSDGIYALPVDHPAMFGEYTLVVAAACFIGPVLLGVGLILMWDLQSLRRRRRTTRPPEPPDRPISS